MSETYNSITRVRVADDPGIGDRLREIQAKEDRAGARPPSAKGAKTYFDWWLEQFFGDERGGQ